MSLSGQDIQTTHPKCSTCDGKGFLAQPTQVAHVSECRYNQFRYNPLSTRPCTCATSGGSDDALTKSKHHGPPPSGEEHERALKTLESTPGPWVADEEGVRVGENWFSDDMRSETVNPADLRLIAAAPELASALQRMVGYFYGGAEKTTDYPEIIEQALNALARLRPEEE